MISPGGTHPQPLAEFGMYVGGAVVGARDGRWYESLDPYSGQMWARVPDASPADIDHAVDVAHEALKGEWGKCTGEQRAALLHRLADIVERDAEQLAAIETRDNGKVTRDALAQVHGVVRWLRYFAGLADKVHGETIGDAHPDFLVYTQRYPLGVVGAILPWNAPLLLLTFKVAPALAAGCSMVVKPSEYTPVSTAAFAQRIHEAGFPPGAFNVVTSSRTDVGAALVANPKVAKVAFTGSTATGIAIARSAADHLAQVTLELGGKSPQLIFADADVEQAVNGIVSGVFAASGQFCTAGSRVFVEASIEAEIAALLEARAATIRLGDPADSTTDLGPISTPAQFERVGALLAEALDEGAVMAPGGGPATDIGPYFVRPTVLRNANPHMRVMREEIFGPVVALVPFHDEGEAIRLANDTPYGLAAGIWTRDVRRAHRVAHQIEAGTVWINAYRTFAPGVPFGGVKLSGLGYENGLAAVQRYTATRAVWVELADNVRDPFRIG